VEVVDPEIDKEKEKEKGDWKIFEKNK